MRWCASTSGTPGRAPSGTISRSSSRRPPRSSRERVPADTARGSVEAREWSASEQIPLHGARRQAGKDVKLAKFINLYGCAIGDGTKIGTFVEIQKNAKVGRQCKISSHTFIC